MIPPRTLRTIVLATNMAWHCGAIPYRFIPNPQPDSSEPLLITSNSKFRYIFVRLSFFLIIFYILFILFRLLQRFSQEGEATPLNFLVQMGYLFWCYSMPVVLQINTLWKGLDIPQFTQHYMGFFRKFKGSYMYPKVYGPRCIRFFNTILLIGTLVMLSNLVIIIRKPYRPHFLTSLFPNPLATPFLVKLPVLLIQAWVWASTWAQVWAFCFHLYAYVSCLIWALRELDLKLASPRTYRVLRTIPVFTRTLRCLHVLHRLWQQGHQIWFCPSHKCVSISVATLASYGVIKLSGPRSVVMGIMALFALLYLWTLLRKFGHLLQVSEQVRRNWMHSTKQRWLKTYLRSVPLFRVDIANFYFVKKTTVVSCLYVVLENTVNLLLF